MTSLRQQARAQRRAAHFATKYEQAGDSPTALEKVARDEWRSLVMDLPEAEINTQMARMTAYLRQQNRELRKRGKA